MATAMLTYYSYRKERRERERETNEGERKKKYISAEECALEG
jgi:hypothetical protein